MGNSESAQFGRRSPKSPRKGRRSPKRPRKISGRRSPPIGGWEPKPIVRTNRSTVPQRVVVPTPTRTNFKIGWDPEKKKYNDVNTDNENSACVICMEREQRVCYPDCGHHPCCYECNAGMINKYGIIKCAICRENVTQVGKYFP